MIESMHTDTDNPDCIYIDTEHWSGFNLPLCNAPKVKQRDCSFSYFGAPDCDFYGEMKKRCYSCPYCHAVDQGGWICKQCGRIINKK